jgi:hypothetical protein
VLTNQRIELALVTGYFFLKFKKTPKLIAGIKNFNLDCTCLERFHQRWVFLDALVSTASLIQLSCKRIQIVLNLPVSPSSLALVFHTFE